MKRSFFTIAYRNTDRGIFGILPELARAGYDGVEIWWPHVEKLSAAQLDEVKSLADREGLAIPMVSGYPGNYNLEMTNAPEMLARFQAIAPVAARLGAKLARAFVGWTCECSSTTASQDYWRYNIEGFRQLAEVAEQHELLLAMETHSQTLVDSVQGVRRMIRSCGPRLKVNLQIDDIVELSGLPDAVAVYRALKDDVVHFHLQPYGADQDRRGMYAAVFAEMNKDGFEGFISWESHGAKGEDPVRAAREGIRCMDELGV